MNILETIILAIVQGITEWLPVSSSGHLVLFEEWLKLGTTIEFDIFLHLASLIVIILFFKKEVKEVITFKSAKKNWLWYIVLSSILTAILGFIFYNQIEFWRNSAQVATLLIVTSALVLATAFSKGENKITWKHAIVLGLVQGFAVLPGISRSGAVIAIALIMKVKKQEAFEYAFLLAIPAILGSFLLALPNFDFKLIYLIGFVITIFVGYLTLALLKTIVKRNYFYLFFIYTLILSLIINLS